MLFMCLRIIFLFCFVNTVFRKFVNLRNSPVSSRFLTNSAKQIFSDCEKSCDRSHTENRFCCRQMFHNHLSGYCKQQDLYDCLRCVGTEHFYKLNPDRQRHRTFQIVHDVYLPRPHLRHTLYDSLTLSATTTSSKNSDNTSST